MKKVLVLLFLILFSFCIYETKSEPVSLEKLDIHLEEGEAALYFLAVDKSEYIVMETANTSILLGLVEKGGDIDSALQILGKNKVDHDLTKNGKENIDKTGTFTEDIFHIEKKEQNYLISFLGNELFVYQNGSFSEHNMLYLLNKAPLTYQKVELALYKESLEDFYIDSFSEKWVDSYKVSREDITAIKVTKDTYHVMNFPHNESLS